MGEAFEPVVPTAGLQAKFCKVIYEGVGNAADVFRIHGFRLLPCAQENVQELPFHMYLPKYFPATAKGDFDWAKVPKELPIGFVARGTNVEYVRNVLSCCGLLGKLMVDQDKQVELADWNCSSVMTRLGDLFRDHPQIEELGIKVKVHIAGHSLGGFLAAAITVGLQDWAQVKGAEIACTTFDSPGLTAFYRNGAKRHNINWSRVIINYVVLPNPINTLHKHLGRIVFLDSVKVPLTFSWIMRCAAHSAFRCFLYSQLLSLTGIMETTAVTAAAAGAWSRVPKAFKAIENYCFLLKLFSSEYDDILDQHSITNIQDCFFFSNQASEQVVPKGAQEMKSWPSYESLKEPCDHWVMQVLKLLVPFHPENIGLHTMFKRKAVIMKRLKKMKGFVPVEKND